MVDNNRKLERFLSSHEEKFHLSNEEENNTIGGTFPRGRIETFPHGMIAWDDRIPLPADTYGARGACLRNRQ